jgi:long-chain fatty acid transport protein
VTFSTSIAQGALASSQNAAYDAAAQLTAGPIFAPTPNAGIIVAPIEEIRFGLSGQGPFVVNAPATLQMRLPSAAIYDNAYQDGTSAHLHFVLPAIIRAGIEVRPAKGLRVEAAYVREFWSEEQTIDIQINSISLNNVSASLLGKQVLLPNIQFPRNFQDSNSYRLGGEYEYSLGGYKAATRLGVSYETSAVPVDWLSISSLDFNKVVASIGGSIYLGDHWRFDAVYAHVFEMSQYVDPAIARLQPENPISGNPSNNPINGGSYTAEADVVGVGMNYKF